MFKQGRDLLDDEVMTLKDKGVFKDQDMERLDHIEKVDYTDMTLVDFALFVSDTIPTSFFVVHGGRIMAQKIEEKDKQELIQRDSKESFIFKKVKNKVQAKMLNKIFLDGREQYVYQLCNDPQFLNSSSITIAAVLSNIQEKWEAQHPLTKEKIYEGVDKVEFVKLERKEKEEKERREEKKGKPVPKGKYGKVQIDSDDMDEEDRWNEIAHGKNPFFSVEAEYNVSNYMTWVRANVDEKTWGKIGELIGVAENKEWAYELEARFGLLSMVFGQHTTVKAEYDKTKAVADAKNVKSPAEHYNIEHTTSKFGTSDITGEGALRLTRNESGYDPVLYWVPDKEDGKIFMAPSPKQPLDYLVSLSVNQDRLIKIATEVDAQAPEKIPKSGVVIDDIQYEELEIINDIRIVKYKDNPAQMGVRLNLPARGDLDYMERQPVPPLVKMSGKGLPSILSLKFAYEGSENFRDRWTTMMAEYMRKRSVDTEEAFKALIRENQYLFEGYRIERNEGGNGKTPSYMVPRKVKARSFMDDKGTTEVYAALKEVMRSMAQNLQQDKYSYVAYQKRASIMPSDVLVHRMVNDLVFHGCVVDIYSGLDYIRTCYKGKTDNLLRQKSYPEEDVSFDQEVKREFALSKPAFRAYIDYRAYHLVNTFIGGGGGYEGMIKKRDEETRGQAFADLGEEDAVKLQEDKLIKLLESLGEPYVFMGLIVPMNLVLKFMEDYTIIVMLPAPYPCNMSVYCVFTSLEIPEVPQACVFDMFMYMMAKTGYVLSCITGTSRGGGELARMRNSVVEMGVARNLVSAWLKHTKNWFMGDVPLCQHRVKRVFNKFYKSAKVNIKRQGLQELEKKSRYNMNFFSSYRVKKD